MAVSDSLSRRQQPRSLDQGLVSDKKLPGSFSLMRQCVRAAARRDVLLLRQLRLRDAELQQGHGWGWRVLRDARLLEGELSEREAGHREDHLGICLLRLVQPAPVRGALQNQLQQRAG